ncbi:MAG: biopolymer transporter ExbD [Polyangiales bacterium]
MSDTSIAQPARRDDYGAPTRATFSAAQWLRIRRQTKARPHDPSVGGELNIVPLLDVVMNVMLFVLATITTMFTASVSVPAPAQDSGGRSSLFDGFTVKITRGGFIVGGHRGFLQADCRSMGGPAVTVPAVFGALDYRGLTQCLATARSNPAWRTTLARIRTINVAGNGDVPYAMLVQTLDAVRETRPAAADLFDQPRLGLL